MKYRLDSEFLYESRSDLVHSVEQMVLNAVRDHCKVDCTTATSADGLVYDVVVSVKLIPRGTGQ